MKTKLIFGIIGLIFLSSNIHAQAQQTAAPATQTPAAAGLDAETLKKANDPMAHTKALNLHNYIMPSLYGTDAQMNQMMIRYAQPIGPVLVRATMPFVVLSEPNMGPTTGLGDFNIFGIYAMERNGNKFGIGPSITVPTGTEDLGQGKWQAGLSALAFFAKSHILQGGTLLQWQASFAGDEDRADVNLLTAQIFGIWQIGGGTYLRSTGIWSFDLSGSGAYNVPIGLGIGKVVKAGSVVFNIFAEPQFSVLAYGAGQPKFQIFVGFNSQF